MQKSCQLHIYRAVLQKKYTLSPRSNYNCPTFEVRIIAPSPENRRIIIRTIWNCVEVTDLHRVFRIRNIYNSEPFYIIGLVHDTPPDIKIVVNRT